MSASPSQVMDTLSVSRNVSRRRDTSEGPRGCSEVSTGCSAHPKDLGAARVRHVTRVRSEEGDGAAPQTLIASSPGPAHRYGTSISDLYDHSWHRVPISSWRWIPKLSVLGDLGFLAGRDEIQRFGATARVVRRICEPEPLHRSFAEVV